jgi:hypothetical protein
VDVRDHAGDGGLAVGAGDRGDRDPAGRTWRKEHVHDRPGDVARGALGGGDVHAKARGGVDLADPAADLAVGAGDVRGDEVDAGDVEADRAGGPDRHLAVVRVDDVGEVDGGAAGAEVAGAAQVHKLAGGEHGVRGVALELEEAAGLVVELDAGEDLLVADAAARVALTSSTSWVMVRSPSPTTWPGTRLAQAISSPLTTKRR